MKNLVDQARSHWLQFSEWKYAPHLVLVVGGLLIFVRSLPTLPTILADEFLYSAQSRLGGLWESTAYGDPTNYLYYAVNKSTSLCGDAFYSCAKLWNAGFFAVAGLFFFLIASIFISRQLSIALTGGFLISPASGYVANFMPEAMYAAFFFATIYIAIRLISDGASPGLLIAFSVVWGLSSLVKPHAWLLIPSVLLLLLFFVTNQSIVQRLLGVASVLSLALGIRIAIGFLLGGPRALSVLGIYGEALAVQPEPDISVDIWNVISSQIELHFIAALFIFGLGLLVILSSVVRKDVFDSFTGKTSLFVALVVLNLIAASIGFALLVTIDGDDHTFRILARYYEFSIPLIFLFAIVILGDDQLRPKPSIRYLVSGILIALALAFSLNFLASGQLFLSDSLWIAGVLTFGIEPWILAVFLTLAGGVFLAVRAELGRASLIASFLIFSFIGGFASLNALSDFRSFANSSDTAGRFTADYLRGVSGEEILIVANNRFEAASAGFWIDEPGLELLPLSTGAVLDSEIIADNGWVLAIGDVGVSVPTEVRVSGVGYTLHKIGNQRIHYFSRQSPNSPVEAIDGETSEIFSGSWLSQGSLTISLDDETFRESAQGQITLIATPEMKGQRLVIESGGQSAEYDLLVVGQAINIPFLYDPNNPSVRLEIPSFIEADTKAITNGVLHDVKSPINVQLISLTLFTD